MNLAAAGPCVIGVTTTIKPKHPPHQRLAPLSSSSPPPQQLPSRHFLQMRPLDESFASAVRASKARPSSTSSRSPSPGLRISGSGHGLGTAGGSHAGGMTYFLTEENNFGVHSMSESHLAPSETSPPPELIEKPAATDAHEAAQQGSKGSRKDDDMDVEAAGLISAIPQHLFERGGHGHTSSVGSVLSPDISTPSSPQHNLSSSAISDDSELDLSSHHDEDTAAPSDSITSSFPQLVMPRVNMPRRKAFTEAGRTMGKLKVMVVGDSGIGKSSLIQAILHTSPDIVHYDPPQIATSSTSSSSSFIKPSLSRRSTLESNSIPPTENILEIKASTRAYPQWWKTEAERDIKTSRPIMSRRESSGEVLERNICFVDTPGYGSSDDFNHVLARVSGYIEECYDKVNNLLNSSAHRASDLLSLFSNGVNGVDLVIYVVLHRLKPVDITIMRHLSTLTNIIPVIAKSDSLSHTQTLTLKISLLRDLRANNIPIFTFGKSMSELERNVVNGIPWAVSCLRDDATEMDASLLMRDDPLETMYVESDLPQIIRLISANSAWLRFSATRKFLDWRNSAQGHDIDPQPAMSIVTLPREGGYAMAKVGDHIDREERLARVRLVQWASDMRKTVHKRMQEEREQYERIESQERIKWLVERLNEAISHPEQSLVPITATSTMTRRRSSSSRSLSSKRWRRVETDPLGLVWVKERWGPKVTKSIVWIVEAGVVLGSGWVVWKYVLDSGLTGWFMQHSGRPT